ncbi:MAG: universal stress protein [Rhodocyclaceae bacterium]|nr:universal stress protein [Rhodocyclaceae bacterium]
MPFTRILLGVDGEPHTEKAMRLALELARRHEACLDGLYVVDPYLKKFTDEIYAVNREECRAHLDRALAAEGQAALAAFAELAARAGVEVGTFLRHGLPEDVIPHFIEEAAYDLLILGGKRFTSRYQRWRSRDLPSRLDGKLTAPLLLVRD